MGPNCDLAMPLSLCFGAFSFFSKVLSRKREEAEAPMPAPFVWCPPLPPFVVDTLIDAAIDICVEHVFSYEVVGALAHDACIMTRRMRRETHQWPLRRALRSWVTLGAHGSLLCVCGVVWAPFARGLVFSKCPVTLRPSGRSVRTMRCTMMW